MTAAPTTDGDAVEPTTGGVQAPDDTAAPADRRRRPPTPATGDQPAPRATPSAAGDRGRPGDRRRDGAAPAPPARRPRRRQRLAVDVRHDAGTAASGGPAPSPQGAAEPRPSRRRRELRAARPR